MIKQLLFATRIPGHVQPVGRPCGTSMHYGMRDVKAVGQQMGYRSLEWNWPKEAMNRPIYNNNNNRRLVTLADLFGLAFFSNRCYKPLSNLEVSRARPIKEPSMYHKQYNNLR